MTEKEAINRYKTNLFGLFSRLVVVFILLNMTTSCDILQQASEIQRLRLCKFELNGVNSVNLAGIEIRQGMTKNDLNTIQMIQLTNALFSGKLPLSFYLMVKVDNPNDKSAALSRMDYSIIVDGLELISGKMNQRYEINAGSSTMIPLPVTVDLFKALSGQNSDVISNLGFRLSGNSSKPVDILFKVKPYINVGTSQLAYPGFIEVRQTI